MSQALDNLVVSLKLTGFYDDICDRISSYGMSFLDDATALELIQDMRDVVQMCEQIADAQFSHTIEDYCIIIVMKLQCADSGEWLAHDIKLK